MAIWYFYGHLVFLQQFGIFYGHLVFKMQFGIFMANRSMVIWYIFPLFGILHQDISGKPGIDPPASQDDDPGAERPDPGAGAHEVSGDTAVGLGAGDDWGRFRVVDTGSGVDFMNLHFGHQYSKKF
jgi:hypothetical protein